MNELEQARVEIGNIDKQMAELFERRMYAASKVAEYKKEHGLSVKDKKREAELIERNKGYIENPEVGRYYYDFINNVIDLSCQYQTKLIEGVKVCYCGIEGAFGHAAAKKLFPEGELISVEDFTDAYKAVENGECDMAVLPLENSYAGEVVNVMDLIFAGKLYINQVVNLPVVHSLVAKKGAKLSDIKTVVSHPQALRQCSNYCKKHGFENKEYANTAMAAKYVSELDDISVAAIASAETAALYGLDVIEEEINDNKINTTRFAVFSRTKNDIYNHRHHSGVTDDVNFILVFTVRNEAGALAQTLNIIGAHGFNMRSLRSRPMKDLQWNYYFYVEAEGNINSENGRDMLQELSAICAKLKLVGSFYSDN